MVAEIIPSDPVPLPEVGLLAAVEAPGLAPAEVEAPVPAGQQLVEAGQSPGLPSLSLFARYLALAPVEYSVRFAVETRTHRKVVEDVLPVNAMEAFFRVFLVGDPAVGALILVREANTVEGTYAMGEYFLPPVLCLSCVLEVL